MKPLSLLWGLVVALVGVVFLAINFGWADATIWLTIGQFWPILIILLGVYIVVRSIIPVIVAALIFAVVLAVLVDRNIIAPKQGSFSWPFIRVESTKSLDQQIDTSGINQINLEISQRSEITIEGTDEAKAQFSLSGPASYIDSIEVKSQDGTLLFGPKNNRDWRVNWLTQPTSGKIKFPKNLRVNLVINGASSVDLTNVAHISTLDLSGASTLKNDATPIESPKVEISGASTVTLSEVRGMISPNVSGASRLKIRHASLSSLDVRVSGASTMSIDAGTIEIATGEVSGASNIRLPQPKTNRVRATGASSINTF